MKQNVSGGVYTPVFFIERDPQKLFIKSNNKVEVRHPTDGINLGSLIPEVKVTPSQLKV